MSIKDILVEEFRIHPKLAEALERKGIVDEELVKVLLSPTIDNLISPRGLPNMEQALKTILKYTGKPEKVLVWGHDDVDGITSVAIMIHVLNILQSKPLYYIPDKNDEGHKLNKQGIDQAKSKGIELIITVDTGIKSKEEVEYARKLGMEVIITDHHELPDEDELPDAFIINPKMGGSFPHLSGSGVAFKLAWGLLNTKFNYDIRRIVEEYPQLLILSAIGTYADKVPLFAENKAIVDTAKELMNRHKLPFMKAYENLTGRSATIEQLIPMLASGETQGFMHETVELLISEDEIQAEEIAKRLLGKSEQWIRESNNYLKQTLKDIKRIRGYVLLDLRDVPYRYIGFIASKIRDKFKVPVIAISKGSDDMIVGEIRTPYGYNSLEFLEGISYLLENYGGHLNASGFSMDKRNLAEFVEEAEIYFSEVSPSEDKEKYYDLILDENSLDDKLFHDLDELRKVGVSLQIYYKGRVSELSKKLSNFTLVDPQQLFSMYSPDTLVEVVMETTEEGFRIKEVSKL